MIDAKPIRARYAALSPQLDERGRRCFAASEARAAVPMPPEAHADPI